jgi:O-antigen/teichoic acid export membrane protein
MRAFTAKLAQLLQRGGVDVPVAVTLLTRVWRVLGGLVTVWLIARCLSPELQGYYYTFNSFAAMQVFAELGLNTVLIQFASHEMAHLSIIEGRIVGDPQAKARLKSLLQFGMVWLGVAGLALVLILIPGGLSFFNKSGSSTLDVFLPWVLLVVLTGGSLLINGLLALIEGCGQVTQVAAIRLAQAIATMACVWAMLASGFGLISLAGGLLAGNLVGAAAAFARYRHLIVDLIRQKSNIGTVHWRAEIWPLQWRIAISWASGYLIYNIFNPILFATVGPVDAGRFGMSLQVVMAMSSTAMAWISTKSPFFGQLIARRERAALDSLFNRALLQSSVFLGVGGILVFALLVFVQTHMPGLGSRLVPAWLFGVLCVVCLANHIVFAEASYLRAHKQEPFMMLSVVNGVVTAAAALILIPRFGMEGAVAAFAAGSVGIGFIGGTFVYLRKKAEYAYSWN